MSRMAEAFAEQQELEDQANMELASCMADQEQMYVESLRRVVNGTATTEDAKVLAAGCGIPFKSITQTQD